MVPDIRDDILRFWFEESRSEQWFQADAAYDAEITRRFAGAYGDGAAGAFDGWMETAEGCLALCILLDQFPRNMFRGTPQAFAADPKALAAAVHAVDKGFDAALDAHKRRFVYLPFEHSENAGDQRKSVALFAAIRQEDPQGYDYALRHQEVIERFGRFPHRNRILSRMNTPAEEEYLAQPGAGF